MPQLTYSTAVLIEVFIFMFMRQILCPSAAYCQGLLRTADVTAGGNNAELLATPPHFFLNVNNQFYGTSEDTDRVYITHTKSTWS